MSPARQNPPDDRLDVNDARLTAPLPPTVGLPESWRDGRQAPVCGGKPGGIRHGRCSTRLVPSPLGTRPRF